jgi:hypothetical protein
LGSEVFRRVEVPSDALICGDLETIEDFRVATSSEISPLLVRLIPTTLSSAERVRSRIVELSYSPSQSFDDQVFRKNEVILRRGRKERREVRKMSSKKHESNQISEPEKRMIETQAQAQETSATDSDISEPRLVTALVEFAEGLKRELQVLSKGFKEITWSKRWTRKSYRILELRRAARQQEVVSQPQFPADRLQNPAIVEGNGNKAEDGTQSPKDWEPSKKEEARSETSQEFRRVKFRVSQQLSGSGLDDTQTLISQKADRMDFRVSQQLSGSGLDNAQILSEKFQMLAARPVQR